MSYENILKSCLHHITRSVSGIVECKNTSSITHIQQISKFPHLTKYPKKSIICIWQILRWLSNHACVCFEIWMIFTGTQWEYLMASCWRSWMFWYGNEFSQLLNFPGLCAANILPPLHTTDISYWLQCTLCCLLTDAIFFLCALLYTGHDAILSII